MMKERAIHIIVSCTVLARIAFSPKSYTAATVTEIAWIAKHKYNIVNKMEIKPAFAREEFQTEILQTTIANCRGMRLNGEMIMNY